MGPRLVPSDADRHLRPQPLSGGPAAASIIHPWKMTRLALTLTLLACPSGDEAGLGVDEPSTIVDGVDGGTNDAGLRGHGEGDGGLPQPPPSGPSCGEPPARRPEAECQRFDRCAPDNVVATPSCEVCPPQARFLVCEAGRCRVLDRSGIIQVAFEAPSRAFGAESIAITILNPLAADGTRLSCEGVLSLECDLRGDPRLNRVNTNLAEPPGGIVQGTPSYILPIQADVGDDRLAVVQITAEADGRGPLLAIGCAEGISVRPGRSTLAPVELRAIDP